ncbi:MAG: hypothetical protein AB1744_04815 [Candidatus Zixiibacteriota bacterium]
MKQFLRKIWAGWKKVALRLARIQTAVLLSLFYFLLFAPLGLLFKLFGWDPLEVRRKHWRRMSNWKPIERGEPDLKSLRRQS